MTLRLEGCSAGYGEANVFHDVSFEVREGNTLSVIGPSGCGKSTLLGVIAGLKAPSRGTVSLDESPVRQGDNRVGLILQHYGLFPWMTVEENVELGLKLRRIDGSRRRAAARKHLAMVGLDGLESRYPAQLSGGQKQRVALARTLAMEPRLLLMDEPFSALDELTREDLQELLAGVLVELRIMAVIVTHSIEEAVFLGSSVLIFSRAPGSGVAARVDTRADRKMASAEYRSCEEYFNACRRVRRELENVLHA